MNKKIYIIFVLFCFLSGCVGKTVRQATIYTISPEWEGRAEPVEKSPLIIKLPPLRATHAFTSTQIIYTDARYVLNSYAYSQWNDKPGKLLQTLFQVTLEKSHLFKAVIPSTSISKADLLLESTLLDLSHHIKEDGTSEGVIRIRFYLVESSSRMVLATKEFSSTKLAPSNNAQGAVTAINRATAAVALGLVNWITAIEKPILR